MADHAGATASSDLCNSCGLCCNGVLFDHVPVEDDESDRLRQLGFDLHKRNDGRQQFAHPCPMFAGNCCSIYAERPAACRSFRCALLVKLEADQVSLAEAMDRVAEAKTLVERIRGSLESRAVGTAGRQWSALLDEWKARPAAERSPGSDAQLVLDLTVLNRVLDRHFRFKEQECVSEDG
jgi:Fe-S-cluster containining protein